MTCQHCNADLPPFALFCGECGRSVSAPLVVPLVTASESEPAAMIDDAPSPAAMIDDAPSSSGGADADPPVVCSACETPAIPGDLYCGECGRPLSADTAIIEPLPAAPAVPTAAPPDLPPQPESQPVPTLPPAPTPQPVPTLPPAPEPDRGVDVESTRIVPRGTGGARFVLQFSTGESYTVMGSGLAGRNPQPEPGEYVDHLVTIVDPARSVSKTHFEFGQRDAVFWFSDRHSGNGSTIREPGAEPRVCEPGRRYPIVRGTRIDIGEQFVIVS